MGSQRHRNTSDFDISLSRCTRKKGQNYSMTMKGDLARLLTMTGYTHVAIDVLSDSGVLALLHLHRRKVGEKIRGLHALQRKDGGYLHLEFPVKKAKVPDAGKLGRGVSTSCRLYPHAQRIRVFLPELTDMLEGL